MSALIDYVIRADTETKKAALRAQHNQLWSDLTFTCGCGQLRHVTKGYRCLYCGEWYCTNCAELHFGQTIQQWVEDKRIKKRQEMQANFKLP